MQLKKSFAAAAFLLLSGATVFALDIPLNGGGGGESHGGANIGYVDLDKIFQLYPQTQAAKEDYAKQLKKKRDQLASKESELADLETRLSVLESTIKQGASAPAIEGSTSAATEDPTASVNQSVGNMRTQLTDKKAELEELRKQAKTDLAAFENQQSQIILGKIYQALRDVAIEQQVTVVVDKSSILYGDATIDLTDKLQQRVRGY